MNPSQPLIATFTELREAAEKPDPPLEVLAHRPGPAVQLWTVDAFEFSEVRLPVAGMPAALDGLRIAHLSDLHLRPRWGKAYDLLLEQLRRDPPDLLLFTGDFLDDKNDHRAAMTTLTRIVPHLTSRLGTYAILGNHDVDVAKAYLRGMPLTLIDGRRALLRDHEATIELIGVPGQGREDVDPDFLRSLPPREPGALRITLCHYPDGLARARGLRSDLFLAGHTHGGQICWPGGKPLMTHDSLPKRFAKGIHKIGPTWLIVSKGFGFAGIPVRMFCPAELVYLRLSAM